MVLFIKMSIFAKTIKVSFIFYGGLDSSIQKIYKNRLLRFTNYKLLWLNMDVKDISLQYVI